MAWSPGLMYLLSKVSIIAETDADYQMSMFENLALALTLTLTFETDIFCLLYYVYDIHTSTNLTNIH